MQGRVRASRCKFNVVPSRNWYILCKTGNCGNVKIVKRNRFWMENANRLLSAGRDISLSYSALHSNQFSLLSNDAF